MPIQQQPHVSSRARKNSSEFDVMIIDEASMIDVELMVELLEAIPEGTGLIFKSNILHAGSNPVNYDKRIVINFNFYE